MNLLVLANSNIWGGAEVFLWRFCRDLLAMDVPVVVVCPPKGPLGDRFRELPLTSFYSIDLGTSAGRLRGLGSVLLPLPANRAKLRKVLQDMRARHGCDVVLCQYPREQSLAADVAHNAGYRSVWLQHSQLYYPLHRVLLNPMLVRRVRKADAAFVISESTKRILVRQGFPEQYLIAIPAAMDPPSAAARKNCGSIRRIGVACRLNHNKGVQHTISAMAEVLRDYAEVELVIAGDGPYRKHLEKMAIRLGVSGSVRFLGLVRDMANFYADLDLLVHVPFDPGDSMPLAILEASACAVPVIASDWAGIPEMLVPGRTAVLVPANDVSALVVAIKERIADPIGTKKIGLQAQDYVVSKFTSAIVTQVILDHLHNRGFNVPAREVALGNEKLRS
jgi:glycosyltransferase involved in cell wall biosynthesis